MREVREAPRSAGFLDGIQRYSVIGRFGLTQVVRGYVAAAVLARVDGKLSVACDRAEHFIVVSADRLSGAQRESLEQVGPRIYDCGTDDKVHPFLDLRLAALEVQRRRESVEAGVALEYLAGHTDGWLVVDGSLSGHALPQSSRGILGLIKSHETQFFEGEELKVALTLAEGCRTSVFVRIVEGRGRVHSWYLRLWPWEGHDLHYGLLRIEHMPTEQTLEDVADVSSWLLAERAPLSAPDGRWDRLIYPIRQVEEYLRARVGEWA